MSSEKKIKNKKLFPSRIFVQALAVAFGCGVFGFGFAGQVSAAALYLRASSDQAKVDSLVTVNLSVDTQGKVINNAEATIQFSNDLVEVVSVDYRSSIFSLWVEQPNFSNNSGRISFNGGIPDPGYKGSGRILSVVFKAKKAGTASFVFSGAAVRENDGLGTDILSGQSSASVTIVANQVEEPPVEKPKEQKPEEKPKDTPATVEKPVVNQPTGSAVVVSPNFPDSNAWYAVRNGVISLKLPAGTTAIQTLLDHQPNSTPTVKYSGSVYKKNISDLDDGIWYFHSRYFINNTWSQITHFRIQIDATAPTDLNIIPEKTNNCIVGLRLQAKDAVSGIDYYLLHIDGQAEIKVSAAEAENIIPWPQTSSGRHQVTVTVFDKAGNKTESAAEVDVEAVAAPIFDSIPGVLKVGDRLHVTGQTNYPNSLLKLFIVNESEKESTYEVMTDQEGKFAFTSEAMTKKGSYTISAYVVGCNNVNSALSAKSTVSVEKIQDAKNLPSREPWDYYFVGVLIITLLILLFLGWYKYFRLGRRLRSTKKKSDNLALSLLLEKANKDILVLEKAKKAKRLKRGEEIALENLKETVAHIKTINK